MARPTSWRNTSARIPVKVIELTDPRGPFGAREGRYVSVDSALVAVFMLNSR
jgi:hypothetical protein